MAILRSVASRISQALSRTRETFVGGLRSVLAGRRLDEALIATGFAYRAERRRHQAERLVGMIDRVRDVRRGGSAALDLCLVACGRLDGYYEEYLNSWDLAAGVLIAQEAGATTSDLDGGPATSVATVAAAPGIHRALVELINVIDS